MAPLCVHQGRGAKRQPGPRGYAVLQNEGGDADRVEPRRDVVALAVDGEDRVGASRSDDDRGVRAIDEEGGEGRGGDVVDGAVLAVGGLDAASETSQVRRADGAGALARGGARPDGDGGLQQQQGGVRMLTLIPGPGEEVKRVSPGGPWASGSRRPASAGHRVAFDAKGWCAPRRAGRAAARDPGHRPPRRRQMIARRPGPRAAAQRGTTSSSSRCGGAE